MTWLKHHTGFVNYKLRKGRIIWVHCYISTWTSDLWPLNLSYGLYSKHRFIDWYTDLSHASLDSRAIKLSKLNSLCIKSFKMKSFHNVCKNFENLIRKFWSFLRLGLNIPIRIMNNGPLQTAYMCDNLSCHNVDKRYNMIMLLIQSMRVNKNVACPMIVGCCKRCWFLQ